MGREIILDVRGMEPPQPLEHILEAIGSFAVGDKLKVLIDCEAQPLYRILERNNYGHLTEPGTDSVYEITIWAKE
jgi:TusA-related sulfurtransferase